MSSQTVVPTPSPQFPEYSRETTPLLKKEKTPAESDVPAWSDVVVCGVAYTLATLFVLSPLRSVLGSSGSKHTVATTAVWFHPVRTLGNLIEVLYYTLRLLLLAGIVSAGATCSVKLSYFLELNQNVNTIMLVCWLSGALGFIGVLKVQANSQSFNTASSAAIIFLVSVLLREDDAQHGGLPFGKVLNYLEMVGIGALISSTTSVLFYRKTSLAAMTSKLRELSSLYADMLDLVVANFGSKVDPAFTKTNERANNMLSQLAQHQKHARYEIALKSKLPWRRWMNFAGQRETYIQAQAQFACLQRQSLHLGGMLHCATVVSDYYEQSQPSSTPTPNVTSTQNFQNQEQCCVRESFFSELRKPMRKFASETAIFVKSSNAYCEADIASRLVEYTHARDRVLRSHESHMDNSVQAACILFAHLLQDIGDEMISVDQGIRWDGIGRSHSHLYDSCSHLHSHGGSNLKMPDHKNFHQLTEALHPTRKATHSGFGPHLWKLLRVFRNLDVRHGIRVGLGAMILSIPAFSPMYRPTFQRWHGEWTVITYMIIMARNLGAMTKNIPLRIIGTAIGAAIGIAANLLCDREAFLLFLVGFFVSLGCYRRILSKNNPVIGRFILLSYNLVCLYSFSVTVDEPDDIFYDRKDPIYDIAFHRVISVIVGILWAVFLTITVWPHSARQALRSNLCMQWMRMGMVWKSDPLCLVRASPHIDAGARPLLSENTPANENVVCNTVPQETLSRFRGIVCEHELQSMMLDLDSLLKNSPNEFRLRGEFDPAPYKQLLESTQIILDAFHSLSIIIEDEPYATRREQDLVNFTSSERRELCHLLFLQFYTASASVRLGFPVPEYLPSPEHSLSRLADKVSKRRAAMGAPEPAGSLSEDNYDFVLFYSYMTVVLTVSHELSRIHNALRGLFGSLDDDILFAYV